MSKPNPLNYRFLRKTLNPKRLKFITTTELKPLTEFVGQERALEALRFGIGIRRQGYNLYAMGPSGIGKRALIRTVLERHAGKITPSDWCYIHNFEVPEKPIALQLPPGMGMVLQQDMKLLINEISTNIIAVFESDEYRGRMQEINDNFNAKRESVNKTTSENSIKHKIPHLYKERHEKEKELQKQFTLAVVEPLVQKLIKKYTDFACVVKYLQAVQEDIVTHVNDFIKSDENTNIITFSFESPELARYKINLLIDHSDRKGVPIVFEENPSYSNLICRVEHVSQFGALVTNFTLIRAGALHKANGGYLIIEARKIKKDHKAWEGLKRALYARKIEIESIEHLSESVQPISLEPMPIPLDVKIILLGDRHHYYSLTNHDPDFGELFKVAVDFDEQIERSPANIRLYARLIGTIIQNEKLRPFDAAAVAEVIDQSSRLTEDIEKLSTHIRSIDDLMVEADYWAGMGNKMLVEAVDVKQAIAAQIHRRDRAREVYYEEINRDFIIINTKDKAIGQVNCLSVVRTGKFSYGHPTRVTAKVHVGKGKIIDIQREIKLAGPIHSKGGLILSNYIASRYSQDQPLALSASLSFEQIYGSMEGDSASVAELCALLSALADVPIKQFLAVTGSVDQYGEVQAIGGVNQKIEGFYDICKARGLSGQQGVLIPYVNIKNLMLREDIVESAKKQEFFVYPVKTIDQAITLLTDVPAGVRNKQGQFSRDSINDKVEKKLKEYSKILSSPKKHKK